ncbi:MAG: DUF2007 domain-containing protein [Planctomycetota bacterium]|nr:DUF2007 domain-containing protein [Planctomycetota bacterium]
MARHEDDLVEFGTAATEFEAELVVSALANEGVEAKVFSLAAAVLTHATPALGDPIKIMVRRCDLETARTIIRELKASSNQFDFTEADAGRPDIAPRPRGKRTLARRPGFWFACAMALTLGFFAALFSTVAAALPQQGGGEAGIQAAPVPGVDRAGIRAVLFLLPVLAIGCFIRGKKVEQQQREALMSS